MDLRERDKHLNELFCIDNDENKEDEESTEIVEKKDEEFLPANIKDGDFQIELDKSRKKLNDMFDDSEKVLKSAKDQATSFSTPRDTEVYSGLLHAMTNLQKEVINVNEKIYKKDEKEVAPQNNQQNNYYFRGDFRELISTKKIKNK